VITNLMDAVGVDDARERLDRQPEGPETFSLRMLGGFELRAGSRHLEVSPRAQQLLALLALRSGLDRSQLAGTLWNDSSNEERALGCLRTELWRLKRQLPCGIESDGRRLHLSPSVRVDVAEFVRRGRRLLDPRAELRLEDVPDPWEDGELLPGWDQEWLQLDRERLRQLRLHVCETAALRLSALAHHSLALDCALGVLRMDPTRESAYRTLVAVYLDEGNLGEARRTFATCVEVLRRELGTAPTFSLDVRPGDVRPGRD
jgi:DNA-binding SARP family transcriptional activator